MRIHPASRQDGGSNAKSATKHAVVIGAGMAGLLAGRVLGDHFQRVTIVERDLLPEDCESRKGASQGIHLHLLLASGHKILTQLFPGLDAELEAAGSPSFDAGLDGLYLISRRWTQRVETDLNTRLCSRALLEGTIRNRLRAVPHISFLDGKRAVELTADSEGDRVTGVRLESADHRLRSAARSSVLNGDLIVDASGRQSRAPEWLRDLGFSPPVETTINSFLGYASRRYRLRSDMKPDWRMLVIFPSPPEGRRGGVLAQEEGGRWIVTVAGMGGDYPPTDEAGFMEFLRSLESPLLYETIADAEPLEPIRAYRRTENRRRHYERMNRWPEGFIVLGDAACAFNPVYGQGMSVSAMGALELDAILRKHGVPDPMQNGKAFGRAFQRRLASITASPWMLATNEDLRYPETEGERPNLLIRLFLRYLDHVIQAVPEDLKVGLTFLSVLHFATPPSSLIRPGVVWRVLRSKFSNTIR